MPDYQRTVHTVQRPNGEQLTAQVSEFKGKPYVGIRSFYADRDTQEFKPGKNGLSVAPSELPAVMTCVLELINTQPEAMKELCREKAAAWLDTGVVLG